MFSMSERCCCNSSSLLLADCLVFCCFTWSSSWRWCPRRWDFVSFWPPFFLVVFACLCHNRICWIRKPSMDRNVFGTCSRRSRFQRLVRHGDRNSISTFASKGGPTCRFDHNMLPYILLHWQRESPNSLFLSWLTTGYDPVANPKCTDDLLVNASKKSLTAIHIYTYTSYTAGSSSKMEKSYSTPWNLHRRLSQPVPRRIWTMRGL